MVKKKDKKVEPDESGFMVESKKVPLEKLSESLSEYFDLLGEMRDDIRSDEYSKRRLRTYEAYRSVLSKLVDENAGYLKEYEKISKEKYILPPEAPSLDNISNVDEFWDGDFLKIQMDWRNPQNPFVDPEQRVHDEWDEEHYWEISLLHLLWQLLDKEARRLEAVLVGSGKIKNPDVFHFNEVVGNTNYNSNHEGKDAAGANNVVLTQTTNGAAEASSPAFGFDPEQQSRWEAGYDWLVQREWIRKSEVDRDEWVYICCGRWTDPKRKIIWRGTTAELACMVRYGFDNGTESKWDTARKVFILKDNKPLPTSFESTRNPAKPVLNAIQDKFMLH